jgi:hypothetical protein
MAGLVGPDGSTPGSATAWMAAQRRSMLTHPKVRRRTDVGLVGGRTRLDELSGPLDSNGVLIDRGGVRRRYAG